MGPTVFHPYLRRLEIYVKPFLDVRSKAPHFPQLFEDPKYLSGQDLNLQPPAQ